MLSGLANLLLGGGEATVVPQETYNLKVTPTEDEWQLVDPESNEDENKHDPMTMTSSAHSGVISVYLNHDSERNSDTETGFNESSIPEHLTNAHPEESWILAPPAIFTANRRTMDPLDEADPLENLLIEHPSMSVYNSAPIRRNRPTNVLQRSALENAQPPQAVHSHQRHAGHVLAAKKMSQEIRAVMKSQACEHKKATQAINRGMLTRANKVYARGTVKVTRRKSRIATAPSGFSNNRKC